MFSCRDLIIAVIAIYLITDVLKNDFHRLIATGITIYILITNVEGLENNKENKKSEIVSGNKVIEGGGKKAVEEKKPIINTGPYDGLCLKTGNQEYWMKSPDSSSLVPNDGLYSYLSSQGPLKMKLSDQSALRGPPVDGVKGSSEKMFMWANNITSPLCCPSTFSTSTGCVCSTKNQRDFIASRGFLGEDEINGSEDLTVITKKKDITGRANGVANGAAANGAAANGAAANGAAANGAAANGAAVANGN
tara:strand:- start:4253 stop:4999 length:747 start_codon:yes stop_codon:yes gene_type:complete